MDRNQKAFLICISIVGLIGIIIFYILALLSQPAVSLAGI